MGLFSIFAFLFSNTVLFSNVVAQKHISPLQWIHTSNHDNHFRDQSGRIRIFHGCNRVQKHAPWYFPDMLESDNEMDAMAELGFNVIRLGFMWTGANPSQGQFNETYLDQIELIVNKLGSRGIHVLLDMHQDVLSSEFCLYDGAPQWVINKSTEGERFPHPWPMKGDCSSRGWMANTLSRAAAKAYQDIYDNKKGMLDDLVAFWSHSAARFEKNPNVIGYEIMNEPFAGDFYKDPLLFLPGVAGKKNLERMHDAVGKAIRAVDHRHIVFFEPVTWGMVLNGEIVGSGFDHVPGGAKDSELYTNTSAFSFHYYCNTFVPNYADKPVASRVVCDSIVGPSVFEAVLKDVAQFGGSQLMTEGLSCDENNATRMKECMKTMDLLDQHLFSWTDYGESQGEMWEPTSIQRTAWARTYARAISGVPLNMSFNNATGDFAFCYTINSGIPAPTEIFVPVKYHYSGGATINTSANINWSLTTGDKINGTEVNTLVLVSPAKTANVNGSIGCITITKNDK